ncbi:MAG: tetratricopeptide repeat protein [Acidobacteria bacterium]|nr:tetratricopeptide repeat protein [Acidobacteriota bacterium]
MSVRKSLLIAVAVMLPLAGFLWFALNRKSSPRSAAPVSTPAAPPNPAHERSALESQLKMKPGHAPVLMRLAELEMEQNRPAEARKRLEQLLAAEPGNVDALLELGRACYAAGDTACALERTSEILKTQPNQPDALYNLGAIHANQGRLAEARRFWGQAVKVAPDTDGGRKSAAALKQL